METFSDGEDRALGDGAGGFGKQKPNFSPGMTSKYTLKQFNLRYRDGKIVLRGCLAMKSVCNGACAVMLLEI